jgi:hypothetical protein
MSTTPKGFAVKVRGRLLAIQVRQWLARMKRSPLAKQPAPAAFAERLSPAAIQHAEALAQIEQAARNGLVPDAHALRVYDSHVAELAETRCQLSEAEADYQAALRKLDAMFPEPPAPPPEPPAPPTPKTYPRMGDLFGGNGKASPLH